MTQLPLTFDGPEAVERYRMLAIAAGLRMWRCHKIRPNRAFTPSAMMRNASELTGLKFQARDYQSAELALTSLAIHGNLPPFDPPYTEANCPDLAKRLKSE